MLRVNRKAKPPRAVGLIQPMFSQRLHHIKTQDLYFYLILRLRSHSQKCDRGASAVPVNLSKYFVTLNHESLMNLLRKNIHDKRGIAGETGFEGWSHGNGLPAKAKEGVP